MKILVPIKQVPDPTVVAFGADGALQPNIGLIVNDYDSYAIEAAIQLKELDPEGTVVVVLTVGPESAKDALMRALAMGADRAVHLLTTASQPDSLAVARTIADEARSGGYDLVIAGQETSDGGSGNVGPQTAALVDWPLVTNVVGLEIDGTRLTLRREVEDGRHVVETELPVVLCALTGLNEPRYPSLKGIMQARKKPLAIHDAPATEPVISWSAPYSEPRPEGGVVIDVEQVGVDEAARQLVAFLRERKLLPA
jgi:electron transfer flavoprotein beta subunit